MIAGFGTHHLFYWRMWYSVDQCMYAAYIVQSMGNMLFGFV